jgi:hypothetical protein
MEVERGNKNEISEVGAVVRSGGDGGGHFDLRVVEGAVATSGKDALAISGESEIATTDSTVVAISGYKSRSRRNATNKSDSKNTPSSLGIFPTAISGGLFGIAKTGPVWRKPRRQTKPGNPKVAADGYEWRQTPTGNRWVLWRRSYLSNGKRGKSTYAGTYAPHSVKDLERNYGKREISKSKRVARLGGVDSGRGSDQIAGESQANFG